MSRGVRAEGCYSKEKLRGTQSFHNKKHFTERKPFSPSEVFSSTLERSLLSLRLAGLLYDQIMGSAADQRGPSQVVFIMCLELWPGSTVTFKWDRL